MNYNTDTMVHLFWTGGWDSTFRLLQLLLIEKKKVQPHYIVTSQPSTGKEIDTMLAIRQDLYRKYPETKELLKPTRFESEGLIEPHEGITDVYESIKKEKRICLQYEFLARYCNQIGKKIEVCVEPYGDGLQIDYLNTGLIFDNFFLYPLIKTSKGKMVKRSNENGWNDIMYKTWYCQVPKNGNPCGLCGSCTDMFMNEMDFRLPLKSRILGYLQLPFRKIWRNFYPYQSYPPFKYVFVLFKGKV